MKRISMLNMSRLEPLDNGRATMFHYYFRADMEGMPRFASRVFCRMMMRMLKVRQNYEKMALLAGEEEVEELHSHPAAPIEAVTA